MCWHSFKGQILSRTPSLYFRKWKQTYQGSGLFRRAESWGGFIAHRCQKKTSLKTPTHLESHPSHRPPAAILMAPRQTSNGYWQRSAQPAPSPLLRQPSNVVMQQKGRSAARCRLSFIAHLKPRMLPVELASEFLRSTCDSSLKIRSH